jgi:endonuclease G, mitochondrial
MAVGSCSRMTNPARAVQASVCILLLTVWYAIALAAETGCPQHFADGIAPDLLNPKLAINAREICYTGFAIMYSGATRTPIYAAEYLNREKLLLAKGVKRHNRFHPDDNIPKEVRAELQHYVNSGYDRGHMAPSADMPNEQAQYESFSLANMIPQNPANNRGAWAKLEALVRRLAKDEGRLYVITGPVFDSCTVRQIGGAVRIPDKLFKVVFIPDRHETRAFLVENADAADVQEVDISIVQASSGIRMFSKFVIKEEPLAIDGFKNQTTPR